MGLIYCPECGKRFSDKAAACPECGCPIEYIMEIGKDNENNTNCSTEKNDVNEKTDEIINSYDILGKKFEITKKIDAFIRIKVLFDQLEREYINIASQIYDNANNIDELMNTLAMKLPEMFDAMLNKSIELLISAGILGIDENIFYQKYLVDCDITTTIEPLMEKYLKIIANEEEVNHYYEYLRQVRSNTWSGGGFGIKGAISGYMKAQMLNAGNTFLHSFSDNRKKEKDIAVINREKSRLLKDNKTKDIVLNAFSNILLPNIKGVLSELEIHGIIKQFDINEEESRAIVHNLKSIADSLNEEKKINYCQKAWFSDPFNIDVYIVIFMLLSDKHEIIDKFAKEYGLMDECLKIMDEICNNYFWTNIQDLDEKCLSANELFDEYINIWMKIYNLPTGNAQKYLENAIKKRLEYKISEKDLEHIKEKIVLIIGENKASQVLSGIAVDNVDENALIVIVENICNSFIGKTGYKEHYYFSGILDINQIEYYENYKEFLVIPEWAKVVFLYGALDPMTYEPTYALAFTSEGIYFHKKRDWPKSCSWKEFIDYPFEKLMIGNESFNIYLDDNFWILVETIYNMVKDYYKDPSKYIIKEQNEKKNGNIDSSMNIEGEVKEEIENVVKSVCVEYSKKYHSQKGFITNFLFQNKYNIKLYPYYEYIARSLKMEEDIEIYALHTMVKDKESLQKPSIACTKKALYVFSYNNDQKITFSISWEDFGTMIVGSSSKGFRIGDRTIPYIYNIPCEKMLEEINCKIRQILSKHGLFDEFHGFVLCSENISDVINLCCEKWSQKLFVKLDSHLNFPRLKNVEEPPKPSKDLFYDLKIPASATIYAYFYRNYKGKREGIAITNCGIFWFSKINEGYIGYEEFKVAILSKGDENGIFINQQYIVFSNATKEVYGFLVQLQDMIKSIIVKENPNEHINDIQQKSTPDANLCGERELENIEKEMDENSNEKDNCEKIDPDIIYEDVKKICQEFNGIIDSGLDTVTPQIIKHLDLINCKDFCFVHDDSLFHSGKTGFAITSDGIYIRNMLSKKIKVLFYETILDYPKVVVDIKNGIISIKLCSEKYEYDEYQLDVAMYDRKSRERIFDMISQIASKIHTYCEK